MTARNLGFFVLYYVRYGPKNTQLSKIYHCYNLYYKLFVHHQFTLCNIVPLTKVIFIKFNVYQYACIETRLFMELLLYIILDPVLKKRKVRFAWILSMLSYGDFIFSFLDTTLLIKIWYGHQWRFSNDFN